MKKRLEDDCFPLLETLMGEDDVVLFSFLSGPLEVEGGFVLSQRHLPPPMMPFFYSCEIIMSPLTSISLYAIN